MNSEAAEVTNNPPAAQLLGDSSSRAATYKTVEDKIANGNGRVARLVQEKAAPEKAIEELYLAALARYRATGG